METTAEHERAVELFRAGHNLFLTGSGGTGKSTLLHRLICESPAASTYVTAMTGAAALLVGGRTLHSFAGVGLAKDDSETLLRDLKDTARTRWTSASRLFVDEVSMMDADLFEKLDHVARGARCRSGVFGGIQVIFVGDFFQLPPVARGRLLFESPLFATFTKVKLRTVFRQRDPRLVELLNAVRYGEVNKGHMKLLRSLARPLDLTATAVKPTKLYPLNKLVDTENQRRLESGECHGELRSYTAEDWCEEGHHTDLDQLIRNCPAPGQLSLRINAQVVNLCNEGDLVNGSRGVVVDFVENLPVVDFHGVGKVTVRPHGWEHNPNPRSGRVTAKRMQLPLKLAWALSIHKAQGMSISCLEVDLAKCFECGQAYVALSRSTWIEGLRVRMSHSDPKQFAPHPKVLAFDKTF